ncbi:hypothetical protein ABFS82_04G051500 [Erythranthe guttata]|uniref:Uncharacterized protein n=1 Tax=Erythranthe guttata TaxID=4155 RepID=A0A022S256_ERYGU|nr:hypothetical protein MIMGU_mgv1a016892mg [Erythranthe guttata]
MAIITPLKSSSSKKKSHHFFFLFFFLLFFILSAVVSSSEMAPSNKTLVSNSSSSAPKTVNFEPDSYKRAKDNNRRDSTKSKGKDEFEASEHEVPSGPNPISN